MKWLRQGVRLWQLVRAPQEAATSGGRLPHCHSSTRKRFASGQAAAPHPGVQPVQKPPIIPPEINTPVGLGPLPQSSAAWRMYGIAGAFLAGVAAAVTYAGGGTKEEEMHDNVVVNWSGTHECHPRVLYQPETIEQLEEIVAASHAKGEKLRVVGSALSPNGLAFSNDAMVSLALLDRIIAVDPAKKQVTLQGGARVAEVVEALRAHGLTLQNFASIREQAIGGFVQVGAHGTGATLPSVDEQVVSYKLVTPGLGTLDMDPLTDPELFYLARVGLGCLGVMSEITLQCVDAHRLQEHTFVTDIKEVKRNHSKWLRENRHLRYMWIPYTDRVVVVASNPLKHGLWSYLQSPHPEGPSMPLPQRTEPLQHLYKEVAPGADPKEVAALTPFVLRDLLLAHDPLNKPWVARVNQAEAEYWARSQGWRTSWSDDVLGFDCGGQQWVLEAAFPTGTLRRPSGADIEYMEELLHRIEAHDIPAPAPIEQRWTAASRSPMSPASLPDLDTVHSWVGIIMYLPTDDPTTRAQITKSFEEYAKMYQDEVMSKYGAIEHWAKIEVPSDPAERAKMVQRIARRYPVDRFNAARDLLDPKNILSNHITDVLLPRHPPVQA